MAESIQDVARRNATTQHFKDWGVDASKLGLLMLGAGAAGRGLYGLLNTIRRNTTRPKRPRIGPSYVGIPVGDEEEKRAEEGAAPGAWDITSHHNRWWSLPASMAVGAGGLYGGWKLTDYLLDRRRRKQIEAELESSKKRYYQALAGSKLAADLDMLFDLVEGVDGQIKEARWETLRDTLEGSAGIALAGLLPLGAASFMISHDLTKKRSPAEVLAKARKRRETERYLARPQPIFARPVQGTPNEDELEGEPTDKVAADTPNPPAPIPAHPPNPVPETPDIISGQPNPKPTGGQSNHPGRTDMIQDAHA